MANLILETAGALAAVFAIACFAVQAFRDLSRIWKRNYENLFELDNWGWAALLLLAMSMACKIGVIGL